MKSISATWFEVGIKHQRTQEDGTTKKVTERYAVDAFSFTEAESRITEEMNHYYGDEFTITPEAQAAYGEVVFSENEQDGRWFKVKLQFITLDEKSGKEKRCNVLYLVQGSSLAKALSNTQKLMNGTMIDYVVASIAETKVMDVFTHKAKED